jgi:hypothetical protein
MTFACYQAERYKDFSFSDRFAAHTKILPTSATIDRCESWKIKLPLSWEKSVKGGISSCPLFPPGRGFAAISFGCEPLGRELGVKGLRAEQLSRAARVRGQLKCSVIRCQYSV